MSALDRSPLKMVGGTPLSPPLEVGAVPVPVDMVVGGAVGAVGGALGAVGAVGGMVGVRFVFPEAGGSVKEV